jgi:SAM-dependent methyltransferase
MKGEAMASVVQANKSNVYEILNSIFYLPAIHIGIETKIWNQEFNRRTRPIFDIWRKLELINDQNDLTYEGKQVCELKDLIEYIIRMVPYHCSDNLQNYFEIEDEEYTLLRNGLGSYFKTYLSNLFDLLGYQNKEWKVLDYAGGNGNYSEQFLKTNPHSHCTVLDRKQDCDPTLSLSFFPCDFELEEKSEGYAGKDWHLEHENTYDLVILSEILHCKNEEFQEYLMQSSLDVLKEGGKILVVEKEPTPFFQWRMNLFTPGGNCVYQMQIANLALKFNMKVETVINFGSHYACEIVRKENQDETL